MALAALTGTVRDFTDSSITGAEAWIHPQGNATSGDTVYTDKPIRLELASNGSFTVELMERHRYVIEILFHDEDRSRLGRTVTAEFRMPTGGGTVGQVIELPARNGQIRVLQTAPGSTIYDQYVYNEASGILYQRTA